jgi:hypothetical protein
MGDEETYTMLGWFLMLEKETTQRDEEQNL